MLLLFGGCVGLGVAAGPTEPVSQPLAAKTATSTPTPTPTPTASETASATPTPSKSRRRNAEGRNTQDASTVHGEPGTVTKHVDGDTLYVDGESVRLIGIDTPETVDPNEPVACYGKAASRKLAELLPIGAHVGLVYDVERTDQYDRTLAYVYRATDGLFVNAYLVRHGYAKTLTIPPNVAHADQFPRLQAQAQKVDAGLWGQCDYFGQPAATPTPKRTPHKPSPPPPPPADTGNCDTADYSGACVPPYPPDVDCPDIGQPVRVVGDDPHGLDRDGDGRACEWS